MIGTLMEMVHEGLGRTPAGVWASKVAESGSPVRVTDETAFLVDFLPVVRRALSRTGFQVDHVQYYCDALRPWIARRERLGRFLLRRDPRDISRIWVLDPDDDAYLEVGYRTLSRPPVSLWEHRAAIARLRELGRRGRRERRVRDNRADATDHRHRGGYDPPNTPQSGTPSGGTTAVTAGGRAVAPARPGTGEADEAKPFEVIEQW